MARFNEIRELTRIRVLSFIREPEAVFWVFVFPMVLAAVLGFAFQDRGVPASRIGWVAADTPEGLVSRLEADDTIDLVRFETRAEGEKAISTAAIDGLVAPGDPPSLTRDPARTEGLTAELRLLRALDLVAADDGAGGSLTIVAADETERRYVDFLFPGLLGMNLMGSGMWGIGFAVADVRRRKFLKRLMVTPMRRSSFFLGFINSRLVFLVFELVVLVTFAAWVLGVPFRGDVISFFLFNLLAAAAFAGLGLLTASRVRTIEGVSGLMNLVMMPMWLGSGVFFSYEKFPEVLHPVLRLLPLTAANDGLRALMLDGTSLLELGFEIGVLAAWCVVAFGAALLIFRWE